MLRRLTQFSVALSLMPLASPAFAHPARDGRALSAKIKAERALKEARTDIQRILKIKEPTVAQRTALPSNMSIDPAISMGADVEGCLISLCGPASQNNASVDTYISRLLKPSLSAQRMWGERFDRTMKENLSAKRENGIRLIEIQKAEILKGNPVGQNLPIRALLGFMKSLLDVSGSVSGFIIMSADQTNMLANSEKIEAYLLTLPEEQRDAARIAISAFYIPLIQSNFLSIGGNPLNTRLQKLYRQLSLSDALKKDSLHIQKEIIRIQSAIGERMGRLFMQNLSMAVLKKAETGTDLTKAESEEYMAAVGTIEMMGTVYDSGRNYKTFMNVPIDFEQLRQKIISEGTLDKTIQNLKEVNLEEISTKLANLCTKQLTASLDMGVSDLRIKQGRKMIQEVRKASQAVARRFNSDPRLQQLTEQAIERIEFSLPDSGQDKLGRIQKVLDTEKRSLESSRNMDWSSDELRQSYVMLGYLSALGSKVDSTDLSYEESELKKACEGLPVGTLSDFSMTSLGKVSVSWFTLNYPEVGSGVLAHEIGHVVSRLLRMQRIAVSADDVFSDSVNCVANRNPNQQFPVRLFGFQDTQWSEEDWADYFSAQVILELEKTGALKFKPKNMACSLVVDLGDSYSATQTITPAKDDVHSQGLLRVIMTAIDKGEMTAQCQKVVDQFPKQSKSLTCH